MSQLSEPGCKACEEGASGVCTRHNEHGRTFFQQQKGEKMPTFEKPRPGSAAAADDLVTWLDDNLANEEDAPFERRAELIEDALVEAAKRSQPAASEPCAGLSEVALFDAALKLVCTKMQWSNETPSAYILGWAKAIADFAGEQHKALQSVPSSPPKSFDCGIIRGLSMAADYVSQHDNLGNIAADEIRALATAQSDAGQPARGKLRCGGTLGLDGDTERDWATDGPAWEKRGMAAEAALEKLRDSLELALSHVEAHRTVSAAEVLRAVLAELEKSS